MVGKLGEDVAAVALHLGEGIKRRYSLVCTVMTAIDGTARLDNRLDQFGKTDLVIRIARWNDGICMQIGTP